MSLLMGLFSIPFLCSALLCICGGFSRKILKVLAVGCSFLPLLLLAYFHPLWVGSHVEFPWFPSLSIVFDLRVDPLSLLFVYLTALIIPLSLLAVPSADFPMPHFFYALALLLQGLLLGFFTAHDLVIFALFWEAMLIPLFFIISFWGGPQRQSAALKFILYMVAGSALMVAAVLALYFSSAAMSGSGTFNLDELSKGASQTPHAKWIGAIFLLAFAVKTPLFPFHAWLPDAYCQAPLPGTLLLSAILSKAGIYGILRIGMELFPSLLLAWGPLLLGLAIAGVFYGGLAAWKQNDFKRLIAYSSLSHVNFILAGLFVWNQTAHEGAILQALNHSITIAALFLAAGWLEERLGTASMNHIGGLAAYIPQLCWWTLFFVLSSVALPGLNNFVGEFLILFGLFADNPKTTALLGLTVILSVVYMLRWMQKVYFEEPQLQKKIEDMKGKERLLALSLAFLILWVGLYPAPALRYVQPAAQKIQGILKGENPL